MVTGNLVEKEDTLVGKRIPWWGGYKGGHPQFKSAPPQLRNIADYQMDCGVAD